MRLSRGRLWIRVSGKGPAGPGSSSVEPSASGERVAAPPAGGRTSNAARHSRAASDALAGRPPNRVVSRIPSPKFTSIGSVPARHGQSDLAGCLIEFADPGHGIAGQAWSASVDATWALERARAGGQAAG